MTPTNSTSTETAPDPWSLRAATVFGIPIRLHLTFLLLVIWVAVSGIGTGGGAARVALILGLFLCVVLHELGHSLVAQRYGYRVRDIVLYPIGGIASIDAQPKPRHEFWIALAGPAINVVIALLLGTYLYFTGTFSARLATAQQAASDGTFGGGLLMLLLSANIMLVLFNLIPAFPMDGGRVLRALLALKMDRTRATQIAATIGQGTAILMGLWGFGLFGGGSNLLLVFIALFVFFAAGQEARAEQSRSIAEGATVEGAMVREFHTLAVGDSLRRAAEVLLTTTQQDFPVVHGDEILGILPRNLLLRGLAQQGDDAYVSGVMIRDVVFAAPGDSLDDYLQRPDGIQRAPILVRNAAGALVGMVTMENVMEFFALRQIARHREQANQVVS